MDWNEVARNFIFTPHSTGPWSDTFSYPNDYTTFEIVENHLNILLQINCSKHAATESREYERAENTRKLALTEMGRQGWFVCHKAIIMPLNFQVTKQSKFIITLLHFQVTKQKEIFQNRDDQNPQAGESWREGGCGVVHMHCPDYECTCKKANKADTCVKPISAPRPSIWGTGLF